MDTALGWTQEMNAGLSGIICCCRDIAWCCPWTCGPTKFQLLFKEHMNTGDSISLFHYSP